MTPLLGYSIDSLYDNMLLYGWALHNIFSSNTSNNRYYYYRRQYDFVGGGYYIMIGYNVTEHGSTYLIRSVKDTIIMEQESVYSISYGSQTLPHGDEYIPLGDMIRLLYGEPSKFGMRLEQYRIENMLETL